MQRITPFLWFNDKADEAVRFYTSIFKNSKIVHTARYGDAGAEVSGRPKGTVMTVAFQLDGQEFVALNGGPLLDMKVPATGLRNFVRRFEKFRQSHQVGAVAA